jgi:hypothetical protein
MNGGFMKTASRIALVAAVGLIAGGFALKAQAADLSMKDGRDLEDRVAELEATTARKGNTKVSLTIYGQVNRGILAWDDGKNSDAYIVDNSVSSSRFGFIGKAKLVPGFTSGYNIEIEAQDNNSQSGVDQNPNGAQTVAKGDAVTGFTSSNATKSVDSSLRLRQVNAYIEGERYGRVTVGLQNTATKDGVNLNLSNSQTTADNFFSFNFLVRPTTGTATTSGANTTGLRWKNLAYGLDVGREHVVRYDTPSIYGFILSASWGENDFWDTAIRFAKEWNGLKVAAYAGYAWTNDSGIDNLVTSHKLQREHWTAGTSVMHVPTGLYVNVTGGEEDADIRSKTAKFIYAQWGIERKFLPFGATTVYGEYGNYKDFAAGAKLDGTYRLNSADPFGNITGSDVNRWGAGVVQNFSASALDVYAQYYHYDATLQATAPANKPALEDWDALLGGMRIKF